MTKRIAVITGFAGFIGINLTEKLLSEGWHIYGIDKLTYAANKNRIGELMGRYPKTFTWREQDISELDWLPECDVIFNLAAESDVDNSNKDASNFVKSNVDGVRNLLQVLRNRIVIKTDSPLFFHFSTDEVYGDRVSGSFTEDSPLNPSNPYAATKAAADMFIKSWARTYDLDYVIVRPSNNYGPDQYPEKLIPLAVKRLTRDRKIKLHNDGMPIRTWTHVDDTCEAVKLIYEKGNRNVVYNISSEFEQNNLSTVQKVINCFYMGWANIDVPYYKDHIDFSYERPGQDVRYSITCDRLKDLGWVPNKQFDDEIMYLVQQYKAEVRW